MPFYKRGFLYLIRKRGKSILLLLIFLFVNSMILSTNMILHATESTEAAMREKAGAKVVCEISDTTYPITDKEADTIKDLAGVTSINRMGRQSAYLTDFSPVTASTSAEPDNLKVSLLSYDDMDTDSPFADQSYRLTDGELIRPETKYSAIINAQFAEANGLQIGDTLSFESESGKTVTVKVIGEYLTGNESQQENTTLAVYRMENQIYIDNTAPTLQLTSVAVSPVIASNTIKIEPNASDSHSGVNSSSYKYYIKEEGGQFTYNKRNNNNNRISCSWRKRNRI